MNKYLTIEGKNFRPGDKIRCKLDGNRESGSWFTGKIHSIHAYYQTIDIRRDDYERGTGKNGTWTVTITSENLHLIELLVGDWDQ